MFLSSSSIGQVANDQVVFMEAVIIGDDIQINWPQENWTGNYEVYRRTSIDTSDWGPMIVNLAGSDTSYLDTSVIVGQEYEYRVLKTQTSSTYALGYLRSGIRKEVDDKTMNIAILVDSAIGSELTSEIDRLVYELIHEGWNAKVYSIPPGIDVTEVKDTIYEAYFDFDTKLNTVFLLGHIPVPYSGDYSGLSGTPPPDGHVEGSGNHTGAWPADVYYADLDGEWTDFTVNRITGNSSRHHNVPSDGKFDQTRLPNEVELELGRVDLYDMPEFSSSEIELLRAYLNRNSNYRNGVLIGERRALVDNNFSSLNLASTGWHNLVSFFGRDKVQTADYFTELKNGSYLWAYGCGAGSYTSCSGVGRTSDFATDSLNNIFSILAGSYFGDWDSRNNLLRAPLANSSLACFWGGIPKWYVHNMALGGTIGWGAKASQNNTGDRYTGNFNGSANEVHIALMGDPSLRLYYPTAASNLTAISANNYVDLNWASSTDPTVVGYNVYRYDSVQGVHLRLNDSILLGNDFKDKSNRKSGNHFYMVRALRIEQTASGSYYAPSAGTSVVVNHNFDVSTGLEEQALRTMEIFPNPNKGRFQMRLYNEQSETLKARLVSLNGQMIWTDEFKFEAGPNNHIVQLPETSEGVYILNLESTSGTIRSQQKIVLSK